MFKVEISDLAVEQYDKFLAYIYYVLENSQAANSLMQDFDETRSILVPFCHIHRNAFLISNIRIRLPRLCDIGIRAKEAVIIGFILQISVFIQKNTAGKQRPLS